MKKALALLLSALMILSLAACGSKPAATTTTKAPATTTQAPGTTTQKAPDQTTAAPAPAEKVKLEFWHSMSGANQGYLEEMIKTFNESQNEVEIVPTYQGSYYDSVAKAVADIAAGNGPDIIQMGSGQVGILAQEDACANLFDFMSKESGVFIEDFVEGFYADYLTEEGKKLNALPMGCSTPVLYCNKTLLDKAGLAIPKTFEEMAVTAKKLVDDGITKECGWTMPRDSWYFWMLVETWGGPVFSADNLKIECFDNGTALGAYTLMREMVQSKAFENAPQTDGSAWMKQQFTNQDCAFVLTSIGSLGSYTKCAAEGNFEMVVAQVPGHQKEDGTINYAVPYGGNTMVMLDSCKNKDAAWKFFQFLYTNDMGIAFFDSKTGYVACSETIKNTKVISEKMANDANYARAHEFLDFITIEYLNEASADLGQIMSNINDAVFYDAEDPQTVFDGIRGEIEDILADHEGRP